MTIIDANYVISIIEKIKVNKTINQDEKLGKLKFGLPFWLRKIVFSVLNPVYVYYIYYKFRKRQRCEYEPKNIYFSIDFVLYCLLNQDKIDLDEYYSQEDKQEALKYINNRIKSCFNVKLYYDELYDDKEIIAKINSTEKKLFTRRLFKGFYWKINNSKYIVPNIPEPSCFYYLQGLSALPGNILDYIENKLFISVGAFWGDTALSLLNFNPQEIWCFEPEQENYNQLNEVVRINNLDGIIKPFKYGIGEQNGTQTIFSSGGRSMIINDGGENVDIRALDAFIDDFSIEVGLIKMDIEGWEYRAILGAKRLIQKFKPIMIISIYHTGQDFFQIPPLLKSFYFNYKFRFLNLAPHDLNEKVLVAY